MRFKSVMLVNFYYKESGYGNKLLFPALGIGYLSEYLESHNIKTTVIDTCVDETDISDYVGKESPDLIGFSVNSICFSKTIKEIEKISFKNPNVSILMGGSHVSANPDLIKKYPFVDYLITKEGEESLYKLCVGVPEKDIGGLSYVNEENLIHKNKSFQSDITKIPFPKYKRFLLDKYGSPKIIGILTSRGCPYACGFCQQSSILGKKWRGRTPESVIEEIQHWKSKGKTVIHIIDDNFAMNKERVLKISNLIQKNGLNDLEYVLVGGIRINQTDEELLVSLKNMGVKEIHYGIESGSDRILKYINKGITFEQIDKVLSITQKLNFRMKLFFIVGFPFETVEDVNKSFELALKYKPIVRFANYVPLPDTSLMIWLKENNIKFYVKPEEYMDNYKKFQRLPIVETKGMSYEEKQNILFRANEVEHYVNNIINNEKCY